MHIDVLHHDYLAGYLADEHIDWTNYTQEADNAGIKIYGYDDQSSNYVSMHIQGNGSSEILASGGFDLEASSVLTFTSSSQYIQFRSAATKPMYFDCGDLFYFRDKDDSNAVRMSLDSSDGFLNVLGNVQVGDGTNITELQVFQTADNSDFGDGVPVSGLRINGFDDEADKYINIGLDQYGLPAFNSPTTIYFCPGNALSVYFSTSGIGLSTGKALVLASAGNEAARIKQQSGTYNLMFGLNDNVAGSYQDRTAIFCDVNDSDYNFSHGDQANPTVFVHSANQSTTEWISLTHDQTNGIISTGAGDINLVPAGGDVNLTGTFNATTVDCSNLYAGQLQVTAAEPHKLYDANITNALQIQAASGDIEIYGNTSFVGNVRPWQDSTYDLGSNFLAWENLYIDRIIPKTTTSNVAGNLDPTSNTAFDLGSSSRRWQYVYAGILDASSIISSGNLTLGDNQKIDWGNAAIYADTSDNIIIDPQDGGGTGVIQIGSDLQSSLAGSTAVSLFADRTGDGTSSYIYFSGAGVKFFENADAYTSHSHADNENPTIRLYGASDLGQKYCEFGVDDYRRFAFTGTVESVVFDVDLSISSTAALKISDRFFLEYQTAGTYDFPMIGIKDYAAGNRIPSLVIAPETGAALGSYDYGLSNATYARLFVFATEDQQTDYIGMWHDDTDGVITTGAGDLELEPSGNVTSTKCISGKKIGIFAYLSASDTTTITTANTYYPIEGTFTNSPIEGFTAEYGTGSITAFADATGGQVTVTSAAHGLSNEDVVVITGTTNYDGTYIISNVATNTFEITATWVSDDATGTWTHGPSIKYSESLTQYFEIDWHATVEADAANTDVKIGIKKNGTIVTSSVMTTRCFSTGAPYTLSGTVVVELEQYDEIQLVVTSDGNGDVITFDNFTTTICEFFD